MPRHTKNRENARVLYESRINIFMPSAVWKNSYSSSAFLAYVSLCAEKVT